LQGHSHKKFNFSAMNHQLLIYNANILSSHDGFTPGNADAMVVTGNHIEAVGKLEDIETLAGAHSQLIDARGRTLMPGLHDTHIHLWKVGNLLTYMLDLRNSSGLDEMLSLLEQYDRLYPEADWITARGFNEAGWKEGRMPTKNDLDKIIKDKPVYVIRTCAHIAICNSKALEVCGITASTPAPEGGVIYKDDSGQPNGLFSETALGLVTAHIPPYNKEQLKTMIRVARKELYRHGITAATDPAVDPLLLEAYYEMEEAGELGFRLQAIPILLPDGGDRPFPLPRYFSSEYMTVNTVKFFSDGGLSGRTAALKRHYKGSADQGILRLQEEQYLSLCQAAQEQGLGIATHAIGDAAIEFVIGIYRQLHRAFPSGLRRIEHLGLPEEQHLRDMAALNIATSMQTIFLKELGKNFIQYLDDGYLRRCYPVRSVLQHGILTALSSDAPVVKDLNPFSGMKAAITRRDKEGHSIAPEESIGIREALQAYTGSAAKISALPQLGSLEPGRPADFILLDKDPLKCPPETLDSIQVVTTFVGGLPVWESSAR
jgi:predicted amidohydrolase YtcJ